MTGEELKSLRKGKKLQANKMAEALEISRASLYNYEQMDQVPRLVEYAARYLLGIVTVENVIVTQKKVVNANLGEQQKEKVEAVRSGLTAGRRIGVGLKKATGKSDFVPSWDDGGPGVG